MSATTPTVTARCVHCSWRTDHEPGLELQEIREIHELIHPGGTVLVGKDEPAATGGNPEPPQTNGPRPRGYWTRERIIEALQAFHREHGRSPTRAELRPPLPTEPSLTARFGGQNAAYVEAGIPTRERRGGRRAASDSSPSSEEAKPEAPQPKGQAEETPAPAVTPEPAPAQAPAAAPEGTLVTLAQRVTDLTERRRAALAELYAVEKTLAGAIADCAAALDAERLETA